MPPHIVPGRRCTSRGRHFHKHTCDDVVMFVKCAIMQIGKNVMSPEVFLLFGGVGSERRVSVATAQHIAQCLSDVRCFFWAPDQSVCEITHEALILFEEPFITDFQPAALQHFTSLDAALHFSVGLDMVWLLGLHGVDGESGALQKLLEAKHLSYTGSDHKASRDAFDKKVAKNAARASGLRVAEALASDDVSTVDDTLAAALDKWRRIVVKPVAEGSSEGLFFVHNQATLDIARAYIMAHQSVEFLIEKQIKGRELTVGVWDSPGGLKALPVTEVSLAQGRVFDFAGKYLGEGVREITPAPIDDALRQSIQDQSILAHRGLEAFGYSRSDFMWDGQDLYFLELNTLPGLTQASFIPQQLGAAGIAMQTFLQRQISLASARQHRAPHSDTEA
jgi:D-alanine-D-alanine ligase